MIKELQIEKVLVGVWSPRTSRIVNDLAISGVPMWAIIHGAELLAYGSQCKKQLVQDLYSMGLLANSSYTKQVAIGMGVPEKQIQIFDMGVRDLTKLSLDLDEKEQLQLSRLRSRPFMLSVSTLVKRKGVDAVMRAMVFDRNNLSDLDYVVAGDGPERARLQRLARELEISDKVFFLGRVSDAMKCRLFEECLFFVMPSRIEGESFEGFGIVYLEAGLFKKAVIGGKSAGACDAVKDGITGLLVDPTSTAELSSGIHQLYKKPEFRRELGDSGYRNVLENHLWPQCSAEFLNIMGST